MEKMTMWAFAFFQVHTCYSLFFTAFIFHTVAESIIGWFFGMGIVFAVYETDLFVRAMTDIGDIMINRSIFKR